MKLKVEFSGGLHLLFDKQKSLDVDVPLKDSTLIMKDLISWLKDNKLRERSELFVSGDNVRPGILVLINDVDWELHGLLNYEVQENDNIVFISTLHGG
mmetsp:Transcript_584/g.983  ORF Transcript_584/g.983 Transcript_584/m.983 type:complete len:98 (+) Transcript_584:54-347(+)